MDEITKRIGYALHDVLGYRDSEEQDAEEIRKHLERHDVILMTRGEYDEITGRFDPYY